MHGFVFKNKGSKFYQASFKVWDAKIGQWKRVSKSTKCTDKKKAEEILESYITTARAAAKFPEGTVLTREYVEGVVTGILASAGVSIGKVERERVLIVDYLTNYTQMIAKKVSASTASAYQTYERKIIEWLGDNGGAKKDLMWLTLDRCEELYSWLLDDMSPKSANERMNYLSRVLKRAKDNEIIPSNPVNKLSRTKKGDTLERLAFSVNEAMKLIDWLNASSKDEWARAAMMAMMAGCRLKDAVTMRREKLMDGVLTYNQSKTGKTVSVPLVIGRYREILEAIDGEYICPGLHKEFEVNDTHLMSSEFTTFVEQAGLDQKWHLFEKSGRRVARKTFHSLRHTLRTAIVSGGGSDAQADLVLGHSAGEGKRYTHSEIDALRVALEKALGN